MQSEFYKVNDVKNGKAIVSNMFSTLSNDFHNMQLKPVAKHYTANALMEFEPLVDQTIGIFRQKIEEKFVSTGKVCDIDNWLLYCTEPASACTGEGDAVADWTHSCVGCYGRHDFQSAHGFPGDWRRCGTYPQRS